MIAANDLEALDYTQVDVVATLAEHSEALGELANIRYNQVRYGLGTSNIDWVRATAEKVRGGVKGLGEICKTAAFSVPDISTPEGAICVDDAPVYLQQELERVALARECTKWRRRYERIAGGCRGLVYFQGGDLESLATQELDENGLTENTVAQDLARWLTLHEPMSDLSLDDTCRRACLILGEIRRERSGMTRDLMISPVYAGRKVVTMMIAGAAAVGSWWGAVPAGAAAGTGVACSAAASKLRRKKLRKPEADAKNIIKQYLDETDDRSHVFACLAEAEIADSPHRVLGIDY